MKRNVFLITIGIALLTGAIFFYFKSKIPEAHVADTVDTNRADEVPVKAANPATLATPGSALVETKTTGFEKELAALPTIESLQSLSEEEVHHTPQAIRDGAAVIGTMLENAEKNPELREKTVQFLFECAQNDSLVNSIRAICWKNTTDQLKTWKVFVPVSEAKIPDRVMEISNSLP